MTKPIPVVLHSQTLGHGGGERQLAAMALGLDRDRYTPHVVYQHGGGFWMPKLEQAGIALYQIHIDNYRNAQAWREAMRLRRYLKSNGVRIAQGFDFTLNMFVTPVAASVRGLVALSTQRCETRLIDEKYRRATHWIHRLAAGVVVNSRMLEREVRQLHGIAAGRVHVVPNGIDTNLYSTPGGRRGEPVTIGSVCVLRPEKNLALLLEAFAQIRRRGLPARLLVVGSGPEEPALKAQAVRLGLGADCEFRPATSEVAEQLRRIDIFVLASRSEGLSNALMEAMSAGCVPVATDLPSNRELIETEREGLLFSDNHCEELTTALSRLIEDPSERERMSLLARARMVNEFSMDTAIGRLQSLYDRLLGKR
jgi:glycosyltransferase involved in cell wall biosynthesis